MCDSIYIWATQTWHICLWRTVHGAPKDMPVRVAKALASFHLARAWPSRDQNWCVWRLALLGRCWEVQVIEGPSTSRQSLCKHVWILTGLSGIIILQIQTICRYIYLFSSFKNFSQWFYCEFRSGFLHDQSPGTVFLWFPVPRAHWLDKFPQSPCPTLW